MTLFAWVCSLDWKIRILLSIDMSPCVWAVTVRSQTLEPSGVFFTAFMILLSSSLFMFFERFTLKLCTSVRVSKAM